MSKQLPKLDLRNVLILVALSGIAAILPFISFDRPVVVGTLAASAIFLVFAFAATKSEGQNAKVSPKSDLPAVARCVETEKEFVDLDRIYQGCFKSSAVPTEVLKLWWQTSPRGLVALFKNGEVIGGASIWPLKESFFAEFEKGGIREREIEHTNLSSDDKPSCFYASEIAIESHERRDIYNLIALLFGVVASLDGRSSFPVSVLALGYGAEGENLMKGMGFVKLLNKEQVKDNQPLYKLEMTSHQDLLELKRRIRKLLDDLAERRKKRGR